jgi:hypothetical protein
VVLRLMTTGVLRMVSCVVVLRMVSCVVVLRLMTTGVLRMVSCVVVLRLMTTGVLRMVSCVVVLRMVSCVVMPVPIVVSSVVVPVPCGVCLVVVGFIFVVYLMIGGIAVKFTVELVLFAGRFGRVDFILSVLGVFFFLDLLHILSVHSIYFLRNSRDFHFNFFISILLLFDLVKFSFTALEQRDNYNCQQETEHHTLHGDL